LIGSFIILSVVTCSSAVVLGIGKEGGTGVPSTTLVILTRVLGRKKNYKHSQKINIFIMNILF
jgi:hypothetical protein